MCAFEELRQCFQIPKTPGPIFAKFNFAKGLAKVKFGGAC
jgi:hypothetical protein